LGRQSDARRWTIGLYAAVGRDAQRSKAAGERGHLDAKILGSIA
jgi:hypothetical protein